ncbi:hypothetical protein SVIO_025150 [Streptomyces violaceusniger]|uniref:Uncharacterized protein n=1 Tax=Streptomyces violaceusniger TaxID=68280 RepID=A0A4D4KT87_STRVO|nr:hypothetical protein SVIO_025150 [Streptomyces violaceusniger]
MTVLGPDLAQVEYRLSEHCGCDAEHEDLSAELAAREDAKVEYGLGEARDLEWIGSRLADKELHGTHDEDRRETDALLLALGQPAPAGRLRSAGAEAIRPVPFRRNEG